jgi:hypothetical protein
VGIGGVGPQQHLEVAGAIDDCNRHVEAVRFARGHRRLRHGQRELQRDVAFSQDLRARAKRCQRHRRCDHAYRLQLHDVSSSFAICDL